MLRLARLFLVITALLGPALQAQPAFLVEDINTATVNETSPFGEMATLGGSVFFVVDDGIHGSELWVSDGTGDGTHLVLDICAGVCSSKPGHLSFVGNQLLFSADDGLTGQQIWKSDGTSAGTARVEATAGGGIYDAMSVGGNLFFVRDSAALGLELWRTDGTNAGTAPVRDINPGVYDSEPFLLGQAGGLLFFSAWTGNTGRELWKSDGTEAGTVLVEDINPGGFADSFPMNPARYPELGGRLFFRAQTASQGHELWVTDGTAAGTYLVRDIAPGTQSGFPDELTVVGNELYFRATDTAHGWELWKSDGTEVGTVLVKDVVAGSDSSYPDDISTAGSQIFFRGWLPSEGYELWKTDGTEAGTVRVVPRSTLAFHGWDHNAAHGFVGVGGNVLFFGIGANNGLEPWKSDGTEAGTSMLLDINPGEYASSFGSERRDRGVLALGRWFFSAYDAAAGWGLWKSDGTTAGTQLVKIVKSSTSSLRLERLPGWTRLPDLFDFGGTLLFGAYDGGFGFELWRSDGTAAGTSFVSDAGLNPEKFILFQGKAFFVAESPLDYHGLFSSDGTAAGTARIPTFFSATYRGPFEEPVPAGETLVFDADSPGGGVQAWKTDGTSAEVLRTTSPRPSWAGGFTPLGNRAVFQAEGRLWRTDGTEAGTIPIAEPSSPWAYGWTFTAMGPHVYFLGQGGSSGFELWRTDGQPGGAALVRDIRPGSLSSFPDNLTTAGRLLFFTADDGTSGVELWKSDGTAAGTIRVADIRPGAGSPGIREIIAVGDRIYFVADDGIHGYELWVSDGTGAGTHLVEDVLPGQGSSHPQFLAAIGHVLLYAADDGTHGLELWRSDGTETGTSLVQDIAAGETPSSPMSFTLSGDYLYFNANDGTHGFELWALDRAELGSALSARKTVTSPSYEEGTVTFEIVITNTGAGPHADNPGDEMVDLLPAPLVLTGASADVGTVSVNLGQNRAAWNGALDPGESATVTIEASIPSSVEGETFFNQAALSFDADGDGTNESAGTSDDPGRPGSGQSTPVVISSPPLDFHTVPPCRVFDTRQTTALTSGTPRTFAVSGTCGIPSTARAVAANLTAVGSSAQGRIVVYPAGITPPATSNLNFATAEVRGNNAMLSLAGGEADALATVAGGGTVHLILDVTGYYE